MKDSTRFMLVGGFLGAGKTTAIARLARMYQSRGDRVAIVTNDQATNLVDTNVLQKEGFNVGEVAGACVCCAFDELTATLENFLATQRPDVILCEPVGSCTDLVATVLRPLEKLAGRSFTFAPYPVILKPSHGLKILSETESSGFSPSAEYIFHKQLEESHCVLLNRVDEMSSSDADAITALLQSKYPGRRVLRVSARTGEGFDELVALLDRDTSTECEAIELDYDTYSEGEAELGWLNCDLVLSSAAMFSLDAVLMRLIHELHGRLMDLSAEVAHVKAIAVSDRIYAAANLVSNSSQPELSLSSNCQTRDAHLIANARVALDPARLEREVVASIEVSASQHGAAATLQQVRSFRPGRPVPTHRLV